jgi:hypothetical protein
MLKDEVEKMIKKNKKKRRGGEMKKRDMIKKRIIFITIHMNNKGSELALQLLYK